METEIITMKIRRFLPASVLMLAAWASGAGVARADTLLYDGISVISGAQSSVQSFNVATPGTLTMTLSSIPWLDVVSNLSGFLSTTSAQIGSTITGAGTESFDLGAGTYYAHWFGNAQGAYNLGVVGLKITFQPGAVPVALPTSFLLMLSGLGLLFGWQNRRTPASAPGLVPAT
jgi:hypothetical protein